MLKFPQNDSRYFWTEHVKRKMVFYGLSADRIKRVVRSPIRSEKGVAPNTIAVMQPGTGKKKVEIWVMYSLSSKKVNTLSLLKGSKKIIITAWKYPGTSPVRDTIPIPSDILEELKNIKF